jgi:hypothetical protein
MVEIERLPDGNWRVSRTLPCLSSAHAAAMALEQIVPAAFQPKPIADTPPPAVMDTHK